MPGRRDDGSVPVDLHRLGHECRARWKHLIDDLVPDWTYVTVGQLDDGRWFLDAFGAGADRTRAYPTKQAVWDAARAAMRELGGGWEPIDCYPTPQARSR